MGLGYLFKLAKLTITPLVVGTGKLSAFEVQYNPETLSLQHESVLQHGQGIATSSAQTRYSHTRSRILNVELIFDGSGVDVDAFGGTNLDVSAAGPARRRSVGDQVKAFLRTCYDVRSDTHEPARLRLTWDKGVLGANFECRLQSVDVHYTSFDRDGSPLRAELSAVFVEAVDPSKKAAMDRLSSPDLTHRRVVVAGDTLPLLCDEIYGSAAHYLRVAEVNGLDDFRMLKPGQELSFPPFARQEDD